MYNLYDVKLNDALSISILDYSLRTSYLFEGIDLHVTSISTFPISARLIDALADASRRSPNREILVIQNPDIVLDKNVLNRIAGLIERLAAGGTKWAIAAPTGIELDGHVHSAVYPSQTPRLFASRAIRPVVDACVDMYLMSAEHTASLTQHSPSQDLSNSTVPHAAILLGYLDGRVSLYAPQMACGINGWELARDALKHEAEILTVLEGKVRSLSGLPTLMGAFSSASPQVERNNALSPKRVGQTTDLFETVRDVVRAQCSPLSLSIITRTQFKRPHLLRRLLASVTRARDPLVPLEVILATDIDEALANEELARLVPDFPNLAIRLVVTRNACGPSRTANLLAGFAAATHRYVAIVDDDDYVSITAFKPLTDITFFDEEPLILMASEVMDEEWEKTPSGHFVLCRQQHSSTYWPDRWRSMFGGVNQLPICALIAPTEWVRRRIAQFTFKHDLSEDYTLHLLLLTAPDLPRLHELGSVFCKISVRNDQSNTVTMVDRRPWVRDISNFLADLLLQGDAVSAGCVQLLSYSQSRHEPPLIGSELRMLREENARLKQSALGRNREIRALREQITSTTLK